MSTPGDGTLPSIPPTIAELTGPLFLGHLFNWGLFGALTVQSYIYYLAFPNDRRFSKAIVWGCYIFELLQIILSTRDAFRDFGTGWGDMRELDAVGWLWFSVPVMSAIISMAAQFFFAWRIWVLSGSAHLFMPLLIIVISIAQGVCGIIGGVTAHYVGIFSKVQTHNQVITSIWLGGTALCDILIAGCMLYYLNRSRTGFRSTNLVVAKFVRLTLETGAACATMAILDLVFFVVYKHNNYHLAPSIALSKIYSNSLLVVLNARVRFVNGRHLGDVTDDFSLSVTSTSFNVTSGTIPIHRFSGASRSQGTTDTARSGSGYNVLEPDHTSKGHADDIELGGGDDESYKEPRQRTTRFVDPPETPPPPAQ